MSETNQAAYMLTPKAKPLSVRDAPMPRPKEHQLVIRNRALAINPINWGIQDMGPEIFPWLKYPLIGGSDVAGEVVVVGEGVTRFKSGDRILGNALGFGNNDAAEGAFQKFVLMREHMCAPIPSEIAFEEACVLPLGVSTAAAGLFQKTHLGLAYPRIPAAKPNGENVLIWAGASSVGVNAIQLAVAAGYEVVTTASPKNFDLVRSLGASQVFDYKAPTIVSDVIGAFEGKKSAGAFAIQPAALKPCFEVMQMITSGRKAVVSTTPPPEEGPPEGVEFAFVFASAIKDNEVGPMIYGDFLPRALEAGAYRALPEPQIVGRGLETVQEALEVQQRGVSARKVVVTL